jgi:peptidoglycan/LPS O-acetylase OafA/YrhL
LIFFYLGNLAIFLSSTFLTNYLQEHKDQKLKIIENLFKSRYNSLGTLLQVISLSLFVLFIKYNKLITKIITFLGPLTFGVYLIHDNTLVRNYIVKKFFVKYSSNLKSIVIISLVLLKGLLVFIICLITILNLQWSTKVILVTSHAPSKIFHNRNLNNHVPKKINHLTVINLVEAPLYFLINVISIISIFFNKIG